MRRWLRDSRGGLAGRALLATVAPLALAACSNAPRPTLAIVHATVIDASSAAAKPDTTVLLAGQRILAVGSSRSIRVPRGTAALDASGKFLIPGLADMHVHLTGAGEPGGSRKFLLPPLLANGVTTLRDMGGYLESLVSLREEIRKHKRPGPEIFFRGAVSRRKSPVLPAVAGRDN